MRRHLLIAVIVCTQLVSCRDEGSGVDGTRDEKRPVASEPPEIPEAPQKGGRTVTVKLRDFEKPVPSGLRKIPEARQMEELFGVARHSISNLRDDQVTADWITETFFGGRYQLTMTVPVRMNDNFDEVSEVLESPKFVLSEVYAITDEGRGASYDARGGRRFTAADWAKVYQAKGDFSVIAITLKKDQPVQDFDKYAQRMRRPRRDPRLGPRRGNSPTELTFTIDPSLVQIMGARNEYYSHGSLAIVDIVEQADVVVAILFSKPVRIKGGPGPSGHKGDDTTTVSEPGSAQQEGDDKPARIDWEYSASTRQLVFNGVPFDLPLDRIAVIRMADGKPTVELRARTEEAVEKLRVELGKVEGQKPNPTTQGSPQSSP